MLSESLDPCDVVVSDESKASESLDLFASLGLTFEDMFD